MGETIQGIEVRCMRVPMGHPHRTASGVITESPLVFVDLRTSSGAIGRSFVFTYTATAMEPVARLTAAMEPLIQGKPLAPQALNHELRRKFRLLGTHGLVGMAIAAIDMAAWDALARIAGQPLCRLLGAEPRPIPAYGGIGYDGPDDCARQAEDWARRGFRAVKAKIGYPSLAEDLAVVRSIQSAVGDEVAVMVDYNQSLSGAEAKRRGARLADYGVAWIEEPVVAEDYAGMAQVAADCTVPIQAGENWWGPLEFRKAIEARATDLLMPDVMKVFGVTGWMEVAALAAAHGLPVSCHLFPEVSAQLLCATPTAHWLEYADWWNPALKEPLVIQDGMAVPSGVPGSGLEWSDEVSALPRVPG